MPPLTLLCELKSRSTRLLPAVYQWGQSHLDLTPWTQCKTNISPSIWMFSNDIVHPAAAYGVLEFVAAVTGNGVLRFERDGQPSDILAFPATETAFHSLRWEKRGVRILIVNEACYSGS